MRILLQRVQRAIIIAENGQRDTAECRLYEWSVAVDCVVWYASCKYVALLEF
jgi:hypothetical protein